MFFEVREVGVTLLNRGISGCQQSLNSLCCSYAVFMIASQDVKNILLAFSLSISLVFAEEKGWDFSKIKETLRSTRDAVLEKTLGPQKRGDNLFYYPMQLAKHTPAKWGYKYEDVHFTSGDGTKLHGWVIPSLTKKSKGVVVFSHGNTGSVNSHFGFCYWLTHAGYDLLMYDYRGYGKSEGTPARKELIEDVCAAFDFASKRKEWSQLPIISMGHSLGATKSLVALTMLPKNHRVKAVVSWAAFHSYIEMGRKVVGDVADKITTDDYSVRDYVQKVTPIPLLVVHGGKDSVIPVEHAEKIFEKAKAPKKLMICESCGHNDTLSHKFKKNRESVLAWIDKQIAVK